MTRTKQPAADAVAWHSEIANHFDEGYTRSDAFKQRFAIWKRLIGTYVAAGSSVLDAGCGPGIISAAAAMRAGHVYGFDASAQMTAIAQARKEREHIQNAGFETGCMGDDSLLARAPFDVILCSSVLEYLDDYWAGIDWLTRALSPSGTLIFSMPNGSSLYRSAERLAFAVSGKPAYLAYVKHMPKRREIATGLAMRGFDIIETAYYGLIGVRPQLGPQLQPLVVLACRRPAGSVEAGKRDRT